MMQKEISDGIFNITKGSRRGLATKNLDPGAGVYGEKLVTIEGNEYRMWNPKRSKLAAMALKRMRIPIRHDSRVLYLGAASGTTVSHVSDMVPDGVVYAVEFSARTIRDLVQMCERRSNIVPILADATHPSSYAHIVGPVDVIFQDVAQPNQAKIAIINARRFLKNGGHLLLSIKARSVDTVASPDKIFKEEIRTLEADDVGFHVSNRQDLSPFHEDHMGVVAERRIVKE